VKGLDVGAPVLFQGVQVGRVSSVRAVWSGDEEIRVPVELTFNPGSVHVPPEMQERFSRRDDYAFMEMLIERGLRGELRLDSLVTGKLYVNLDFYPEDEARRFGGTEHPELPTIESGFLRIQKELESLPTGEIIAKTVAAIEALDELVTSGQLEEMVERFNSLTLSLEQQVVPLSESMQETLARARDEMGDIKADLRAASDSIQTVMGNADVELQAISGKLQQVIESTDEHLGPLATSATAMVEEARRTLASVDGVLGEDPTMLYRTAAALEELAAAARSIRQLADYIERHPEALITGKKN
jgi:paraquat-inducible protein B